MSNEKETLRDLFILTAGFRGHLGSLATLNTPCRASLLNKKITLANLAKRSLSSRFFNIPLSNKDPRPCDHGLQRIRPGSFDFPYRIAAMTEESG